MPARDTEVEKKEPEASVEVAPPAPEEAQQEFTSEGELPAVAEPAAAAGGATASELGFGKPEELEAEKKVEPDASHLNAGVHDPYHYREACEKLGQPDKWKAHYINGHTEAKGWDQPYEHRASMDFTLKKNTSASKALQDFLKGPTIADYRAHLMAEEVDEIRDNMGDRKFDLLFGSSNSREDHDIPKEQRLRISASLYTVPIGEQMKQIERDYDAKQNAEPEVEEKKAVAVEQRIEEKPKAEASAEPELLRQELGLEQQDRQLV